jgi:hypothetical protein
MGKATQLVHGVQTTAKGNAHPINCAVNNRIYLAKYLHRPELVLKINQITLEAKRFDKIARSDLRTLVP